MARLNIDNLDTKILQMLVDNGRKPFLEIARECGVSGAAIHQRIAKLQATNILEGSRALIKPTTLGYDTCAFVGVFLKEPDKFNEFVENLKNVPEVVECHFTTGQYDMLIKMYAHDNEHLLHLIHERLQPLGILRTETLVSFREVFSRALPVSTDPSCHRPGTIDSPDIISQSPVTSLTHKAAYHHSMARRHYFIRIFSRLAALPV